MPTKWIYEPRDLLWLACCRAAYERMVVRAAAGGSHEADARRLPELLRETELTALDFQNDVQAAREGKPPRQWPEASPVIVTEEEDLPEGQVAVA